MKRPSIPAKGVAYLRKVVEDNMLDQVKIVRPNVPVYDKVKGYATGVTQAVGYTGMAHVHPTTPDGTITVGEGMQAMAFITVTIPYDAPSPRVEDHVLIVSIGALADQTLAGETLRIINVSGGGLGYVTRELTCTLVQSNPYDPGA